jgi:hypothetical protein
MSAIGVLDLLAQSRGPAHRRGESLRADWRGEDGLLSAVAATLLAEGKDSPAARQVLARVIARGLLAEVCADLAGKDPGAAAMASQLAARLHPEAARAWHASTPETRALKAEEESILAEWLRLAASAAGRIFDSSGNAHLRSRLALAWGRIARLAAEGQAWLDDDDPRVRANAVESLWGLSGEREVAVFLQKLGDEHQRVAANAAVGLYLAGRPESVAALWNMAHDSNPARRAAGVWAIGRTGDARFLPLLGELRRTKGAPVSLLRNVVLARERIHQVDQLPRETVDVRLHGISPGGAFRCSASLGHPESGQPAPLRPTDFSLQLNGRLAWQYNAWRTALASPDALCLAVPAPSAEQANQRAIELASAAGPSTLALLRLVLGYDNGGAVASKTGEILGLGGASPGGEWFAAGEQEWIDRIRRAARRLAAESSRARIAAVVGRGAPPWLPPALASAARESAAGGASFTVLHEPGALDPDTLATLRAAGGEAIQTPDSDLPSALRRLFDSQDETWQFEVPSVDAGGVRSVKLVLRSGWLRGEAEVERAS